MNRPVRFSPPACVIHCRVSTAKQAYEGESLVVQQELCAAIARERGWRIAHEPWAERFSGRKQRPLFAEILAYLDEHPGQVKYYLFRSIDRFTRGGTLAYEQMKRELTLRGVEMVDSFGIIQPIKNTLDHLGFEYDWSRSSPSEISEAVVATAAKHEVTTILTRLIGQEIRLTQRGYKLRAPSDGYENKRVFVEGLKRTIQVPHPERAQYVIAMYELRASGQHTDAEICERLNGMGYRTPVHNRWDASHARVIGSSGGNPLTPKHLQSLIKRPIYCGIVCETWTRWLPVRAAYDGLVSIDLFNRANRGAVYVQERADGGVELLYNHSPVPSVKRLNRVNPDFPLKHVIRCPQCKKLVWGSAPRGRTGRRYPTYHCKRHHKYWGMPKAELEDVVRAFLFRLRFAPETIGMFRSVLIDRYRQRQAELLRMTAVVGSNVSDLEIQLASVADAFKRANTDFMRASMEADAERLREEIEKARTVRHRLELTEEDIELFVRDVQIILEHPAILLENPANTREMQALWLLAFERLPTVQEIALGTAKLSRFFYIISTSEDAKSALVRLRRLSWNQIEAILLQWKENRHLLLRLRRHDSTQEGLMAA